MCLGGVPLGVTGVVHDAVALPGPSFPNVSHLIKGCFTFDLALLLLLLLLLFLNRAHNHCVHVRA